MVSSNRRAKVEKIKLILDEALTQMAKPASRKRLLDVATGNGEIACNLSEFFDVTSVDVLDQRAYSKGYSFIHVDSEKLPFPNSSFDLVISNHVIEHVKNADMHLSEISRVLKKDGLAYLATPNRLWPREVHNKVYFLHYLPPLIFNVILKSMGKHHEDVYLLTWRALRQKADRFFTISIVSHKICKWPLKYHMQCSALFIKILSRVPLVFFRMFAFIHPTLVVVLKK